MNRRLFFFFGLAFSTSWACWSPLLLARWGVVASAPRWLHLVGSLGPCAAALVAASCFEGADALRRVGRSLLPRNVSPIGWLVSLGGPLLLLAIGAVAQRLVSGAWIHPADVLRSREYPALGPVALLAAQIFFYGLGEEVGWRGYALPRMAAASSTLKASLWLSLPWALWHVPLLLVNDTYREMGIPGLMGWLFSIITGSILMGWLSFATGGSVLAIALFHGLLDLVMINSAFDAVAVNAIGGAVTTAGIFAAGALSRAQGPRPGASPGDGRA